jgi:isocitrate lyase
MATTHQKFVGTGYFDRVMEKISSGETSLGALSGSTEEEQF